MWLFVMNMLVIQELSSDISDPFYDVFLKFELEIMPCFYSKGKSCMMRLAILVQ